MNGIEVTRAVKQRHPEMEVLIFTVFEEEEKVLAAVRAGASGYLLKGAPAERIVDAIREVNAGGTVIQPSLARKLLRHFREGRQKYEVGEAEACATLLATAWSAANEEGADA
jgi:DNA-binding NarL/FixJ family response regulator